jgi:pimeloyl-ACP methyl ester carboxylesterase
VKERDLRLADGRTLHTYDTGHGDLVILWHHGTPNTGVPPAPLFQPGLRWVAYDRPRYGGSTVAPGRAVASAAADVAAVADALDLERFAVLGHSGGGPHALACAALLPDRVSAAVAVSSLAPFGADGLDWFAGMGPESAATLRAAAAGRAARERHVPGDLPDFTAADRAALEGPWSWFSTVVEPALRQGPAAAIDDDLAYVAPWGFDPARIAVPVLLLHGTDDRMVPSTHGAWLAERIPAAELRLVPGEGHISVLTHAAQALAWLRQQCT